MDEISIPELVWSVANVEFMNIFDLIELIDNKISEEVDEREKDIKEFQKKYDYHNTNNYDLIENHLIDKHIISMKDYPNIIFQ